MHEIAAVEQDTPSEGFTTVYCSCGAQTATQGESFARRLIERHIRAEALQAGDTVTLRHGFVRTEEEATVTKHTPLTITVRIVRTGEVVTYRRRSKRDIYWSDKNSNLLQFA